MTSPSSSEGGGAIVVVGSLNMDFSIRVERLPAPGATVLGRDFQMTPGGKGANQAFAAGRLSKKTVTRMIGRIGHDLPGDHLKAGLAAAGVDVSFVFATRSVPTGTAMIWVDGEGQNSIAVSPGANAALRGADAGNLRPAFVGARYALFQLETPVEAVAKIADVARQEGAKIILDPAPARPLDPALLAAVDLLTPNETEACLLLGRAPARMSVLEAPAAAKALLATNVAAIVIKLGEQGCFYQDRRRSLYSTAFPVKAMDTTAAGDTFNAALAVALAEDQPIEKALRFANAAAALSVTRAGAQASIPTRAEVDTLLN